VSELGGPCESKNGAGQAEREAGRPCVVLMTDSFRTGGSERQFTTMARALRSEAFRVRLACLSRIGDLAEGMDDVAELDLGGSFFGFRALRAQLALVRFLGAQGAAIAHSFDFYSNLMLIPMARVAGVPVVIGSQRQLGDLLTPLQFGVQVAAFQLCDRVVCNSYAAARRLADQGVSEQKLVVIPNGLPDDAFADVAPALERRPGVLRVGMIARMNNPVKNHGAFLRAAARLAGKFPTVEFVLAGDGPLRPGLERLSSSLGLERRLVFLGDRRDVTAVLASLDVSVLPSFSESLPNAILESMAAGVPVVATRVGGNAEVVSEGETGLLVPADNDDRLVEAVESLLKEPSLRLRCGRQAREMARADFGLSRIRDRFEQLYVTLLAEKHWRPTGHRKRSALEQGLCRPPASSGPDLSKREQHGIL